MAMNFGAFSFVSALTRLSINLEMKLCVHGKGFNHTIWFHVRQATPPLSPGWKTWVFITHILSLYSKPSVRVICCMMISGPTRKRVMVELGMDFPMPNKRAADSGTSPGSGRSYWHRCSVVSLVLLRHSTQGLIVQLKQPSASRKKAVHGPPSWPQVKALERSSKDMHMCPATNGLDDNEGNAASAKCELSRSKVFVRA